MFLVTSNYDSKAYSTGLFLWFATQMRIYSARRVLLISCSAKYMLIAFQANLYFHDLGDWCLFITRQCVYYVLYGLISMSKKWILIYFAPRDGWPRSRPLLIIRSLEIFAYYTPRGGCLFIILRKAGVSLAYFPRQMFVCYAPEGRHLSLMFHETNLYYVYKVNVCPSV